MTINFNGKNAFPSCTARIEAAGYSVRMINNVLTTSDDDAVQAIIDAFTLDDAKADKCEMVLAKAKELRDKVTSGIAQGEMAAWPIKRDEALAYGQLGEMAACPGLRAEASARNITLEQLVAKVDSNAARFLAAEAAIGGTDGRHRDAINALTTFEEVDKYDFSTGWPEV